MDARRKRLTVKIRELITRRDDWLSASQIAVLVKSSKPLVAEILEAMPNVWVKEARTKNGHLVNVYTIKRSAADEREEANTTELAPPVNDQAAIAT